MLTTSFRRSVRPLAARLAALGATPERLRRSVFGQLHREMRGWTAASFRRAYVGKGHGGQRRAFKVKFLGEGVNDYGGPYREALAQICAELHSETLPLLVRSPNCVHGAGGNREVYVPNPSALGANELDWYCFVGQLLGLALRQRETQVHTGRH